MVLFLKRLFLFIPAIIIGAFILDFAITKYIHSSKSPLFNTWNLVYDGKIDADLAIYGSSRAASLISPKILEDSLHLSTYNFGLDGQYIPIIYLMHKQYFKYNTKKPKYIVLQLDLHTLNTEDGMYDPIQLTSRIKENKEYIDTINAFYMTKPFRYLDDKLPLYRYIGDLFKAIGKTKIKTSLNYYKGYNPVVQDYIAPDKRLKLYYSLNLKRLELLDAILADAKKDNITVIFTTFPMHQDGINSITNQADLHQSLIKIAADRNIKYFDYLKLPEFTNNADYFYNSQHLNMKGAEKMTAIFAKDLKAYIDNTSTSSPK